jgi:hypothetical protein
VSGRARKIAVSVPAALVVALAAAGCSSRDGVSSGAEATLDRPVPRIGRGAGYELPPAGNRVERADPVEGLSCGRRHDGERFGVHLEVFAHRRDVVVPAGIGIAPPRSRAGAYVTGGRCEYPVRTHEPTGLIELDSGTRATLGQLFALWGEPLGRRRALGFHAPRGEAVSAFVNGRRWAGDPRAIPLDRHATLVIEVGGYFPPTRRYLFPGDR